MIGVRQSSTTAKIAVGMALGAAGGLAVSALGLAPVDTVACVLGGAIGGGLGPLAGPRLAQTFRNLAEDAGTAINKGYQKAGQEKWPLR